MSKTKTLPEWIELYNRKTPEPFKRDERFRLFFLPDKGFCEIGNTEKMIVINQLSGDGRFWKKFAEEYGQDNYVWIKKETNAEKIFFIGCFFC